MKILSRFSAAAMALGLALGVWASPLSPQAALSAARGSEKGRMKIAARDMTLVHTVLQPGTSKAGLYLFAPEQGEGFIVTAADDDVRVLLGYSDSGTLDVDNLPPAFQWWLEATAGWIEYEISNAPSGFNAVKAANVPSTKMVAKLPDASKDPLAKAAPFRFVAVEGTGMAKAPAAVTRSAIAPLVTSTWDQDSPYNDQCPLISGQHTYTGCGATAEAQIMNYHQYPAVGTGSHSYTWEWYGSTYSDNFNFSSNPFNWSAMLDSYANGTGTSTQRSAVARLMHACGVASDMMYGLDGSGAYITNSANGWLTYFDYDHSMQLLWRELFSAQEWGDIIYSELAAGRPVFYTGQSTSGGHAFVCDGYSANDYFHINWGWSGIADGYYYLYNLTPDYSGIGGADLGDGYNSQQQVLVNIKPQEGGAVTPAMIIYETSLSTDANYYSPGDEIVFYGPFYSIMPLTSAVTTAVKLSSSSGVQYIGIWQDNIPTYSGYNRVSIDASSFPQGKFEVSLACRVDNGPWADFYCYDGFSDKLYFDVTADGITVSSTPFSNEATLVANIEGIIATNGTDEYVVAGHSYDVTFCITSDTDWEGDLYYLICDTQYYIKTYNTVHATIPAGSDVSLTCRLDIPDMETGQYIIGVCRETDDGGLRFIDYMYYLNVINLSEDKIEAYFVGADPVSHPDDTEYTFGHSYNFNWNLTSSAPWTGDFDLTLLVESDGEADEVVTDDVESYESFAVDQAGDWSFIDGDGSANYGFSGITFPGNGIPASFIVFDKSISDDLGDIAYSGDKAFACFAAINGPNDDWLISPELSGSAQTISFMARAHNTTYGLERYEVYYSTSGKNRSDFVKLDQNYQVDDTWTKYSYNLPEGARYFAIRCVSDDAFVLYIDNIKYTRKGSATNVRNVVIGKSGEVTLSPDEITKVEIGGLIPEHSLIEGDRYYICLTRNDINEIVDFVYSFDFVEGNDTPDPNPDPDRKHGDYNGDGFVDIQDVYYIIDLIHSGAR